MQPGLARGPLLELVRWTGWIWPLEVGALLIPVGMVGASPNVLLAHPSFAPRNLKELSAYTKANPDKVSYGSGGAGTSPHMSGELLKTLGIPMTHISYKGTGPALTDLLSGQTQLMMSTMGPSMPLIKSGQVRPIAITSLKRSSLLPDTPTVAESLPGYEAVTWYAILVPAATPKPVVEKLRAALDQVLAMSDMAAVIRAHPEYRAPAAMIAGPC